MAFQKCTYYHNRTVITAENLNCIQDAICELERLVQGGSLTHYTSLEELELSGAVATADLLEAMPANSMLLLACDSTQPDRISDAPGSLGVLVAHRTATFAEATWTQVNTPDPSRYHGSWHSTGGWSGWHEGGGGGSGGGLLITDIGEGLVLEDGVLSLDLQAAEGVAF